LYALVAFLKKTGRKSKMIFTLKKIELIQTNQLKGVKAKRHKTDGHKTKALAYIVFSG